MAGSYNLIVQYRTIKDFNSSEATIAILLLYNVFIILNGNFLKFSFIFKLKNCM